MSTETERYVIGRDGRFATLYDRQEDRLILGNATATHCRRVRAGRIAADAWNEAHPIGTPVMAYPGIRPEDEAAVEWQQRAAAGRIHGADDTDPCKRLETRTRTVAWTLSNGEPVVMVDGYSGGIALAHVDAQPAVAR